MVVIHSTNPALKSPLTAINIKLTVQFPPAKVRIPRVRPPRMTSAFTGSRMMTVSSLMRSVEAASIQYPFHPLFRNGPYISVVYSPPWQVISTSHATSSCASLASMSTRPSPASLGAGPPTLEVEKKTGLMPAKSFSSRILCMRTLPTIPLHPIKPTLSMSPPDNIVYLAEVTCADISSLGDESVHRKC